MASVNKVRQIQLDGQKIRQLRKEHKLTQVELSHRLGIQQSDLSRMEQGEYRVSLDTLFRILAEFKVGIGDIMGHFDQPEEYISWLKSGSHFQEKQFHEVWERVIDFTARGL